MASVAFAVVSALFASVGSISARTSPCLTACPTATFTFVTFSDALKLRLAVADAATVPLVLIVFVMLPVVVFASVKAGAAAVEPPRNHWFHVKNPASAPITSTTPTAIRRRFQGLLVPSSRSSKSYGVPATVAMELLLVTCLGDRGHVLVSQRFHGGSPR